VKSCGIDETCGCGLGCEFLTHNECVGQQCKPLAGAGPNFPDRCSDNDQCVPPDCNIDQHAACVGLTCTCVELAGPDLCQNSSECIINAPPFAENLSSVPGSPCTGIPGTGIAYFQWTYRDTDIPPDLQKKFVIQIDDNADFSSPEVSRIFDNLSYPDGTLNQQTVFVITIPTVECNPTINPSCSPSDYINYNVDYYWRVKVEEWLPYGQAQSSDWVVYSSTFTMTGHPAPSPEFGSSPLNPSPGKTVYFSDSSICYDNSNPYSCQSTNPITGLPNSYAWDFDDGGTSVAVGDVSHIYTVAKTSYAVNLNVCDENYCCNADRLVPVRVQGIGGLPNWREISPFK